MSAGALLLTGSVPLADTRAVFAALAHSLGDRLARWPDGETGARANWIACQRAVFAAVTALEPTPAKERDYQLAPPFALRAGAVASDVRFGPLGYLAAARDSFAIFRALREAGEIPPTARFLVAIPTAWAPVYSFTAYRAQPAVYAAYVGALVTEIGAIASAIPHDALAIQLDIATEMSWLERVYPAPFEDVESGVIESIAALACEVPREVELGLHFCYGSMGNRHWKEPSDLGLCVGLANRLLAHLASRGRAVGYLHMPVPVDRHDRAFFAPLAQLRRPVDCELFLGLLHLADGVPGTLARTRAAREFAPTFGLACECGLGRHRPDVIPAWLDLHAASAAAVASLVQ